MTMSKDDAVQALTIAYQEQTLAALRERDAAERIERIARHGPDGSESDHEYVRAVFIIVRGLQLTGRI